MPPMLYFCSFVIWPLMDYNCVLSKSVIEIKAGAALCNMPLRKYYIQRHKISIACAFVIDKNLNLQTRRIISFSPHCNWIWTRKKRKEEKFPKRDAFPPFPETLTCDGSPSHRLESQVWVIEFTRRTFNIHRLKNENSNPTAKHICKLFSAFARQLFSKYLNSTNSYQKNIYEFIRKQRDFRGQGDMMN